MSKLYTSTAPSTLSAPLPPHAFTLLTFPTPQILLITMNRPTALNAVPNSGHHELHSLFTFYDAEPSLRCCIITGAGRAFCVGADLKEWQTQSASGISRSMPVSGFGGLSRRVGRKPVIAAVNGLCFGGGMEMIINADMVLASGAARFGLPEVRRGVGAIAGALPRLIRAVGKVRAGEMAGLGRTDYNGEDMRLWGLVNKVCEDVVDEAVRWAEDVCRNSPDSVLVTKRGLAIGWEGGGVEEGSQRLEEGIEWRGLQRGENIREGLRAFVEKREPRWVDSKL